MMEAAMSVNLWAVLVAALSTFLLGGIWYSPLMFCDAWVRGSGLTEEQAAARNMGLVFGLSFVAQLLAAYLFAMFIGPAPALGFALAAGVSVGAGWVATSFAINYLFEHRGLTLWLINGGFHTLQFTLYGLILGLWH